jgi:hypothetical protein
MLRMPMTRAAAQISFFFRTVTVVVKYSVLCPGSTKLNNDIRAKNGYEILF